MIKAKEGVQGACRESCAFCLGRSKGLHERAAIRTALNVSRTWRTGDKGEKGTIHCRCKMNRGVKIRV